MACKYFYQRNGRCVHLIKCDGPADLCKMKTRFLCTLGEDESSINTTGDEIWEGGGMILSHSSRESFISCRRAFYLNRVKRIDIRKSMLPLPVKLGAIWDKYMESRYLGIKFMDKFWELVDEYNIEDDMDVAKIYGLIKAHRKLEMEPYYETSDGGIFRECQHRFEMIEDGDFSIVGYIDREYSDHIVETKLTGRPDFYFSIHNITSQIGTYFLSNHEYKYAVIESTRVPGTKTGKGKYSDESSEAYQMRIVGEILSRPSYYFLGYDRDKKVFGKRFWRNEFDMDEILRNFTYVNREIRRAMDDGEDAFYKNRKACYVPGPCFYLNICDTGCVSESIYEIRSDKKHEDVKKESDGSVEID